MGWALSRPPPLLLLALLAAVGRSLERAMERGPQRVRQLEDAPLIEGDQLASLVRAHPVLRDLVSPWADSPDSPPISMVHVRRLTRPAVGLS